MSLEQRISFSPEVITLSHHVGEFIEYWGFKSIHGKVWLLIYLSKAPLDARDLIHNLDVTKGLISTALKELAEYDLIQEVDIGNNKSKYYQARKDVMGIITNVLKGRELTLMNGVIESFDKIKSCAETNIDQEKFKSLGRVIKFGNTLLKGIIKLTTIDLRPWKSN